MAHRAASLHNPFPNAEGTDAHRLSHTLVRGWVERFERDILISFKQPAVRERLFQELYLWSATAGFSLGRIFTRFLPKRNEERETPRLLSGNAEENLQTIGHGAAILNLESTSARVTPSVYFSIKEKIEATSGKHRRSAC